MQQLARLTPNQREAHRLYRQRLDEYDNWAKHSPETDELTAKAGGLRSAMRALKRQRLDERNRAAQLQRELEAQKAKLRIKIKQCVRDD